MAGSEKLRTMDPRRKRYLIVAAAVLLAAAVGASLAWKYTPLRDVVTIDNMVAAFDAVDNKWWAPIVAAALYTPACLVMFPRAILTMAIAAVFGPIKGFAIAMSGVLLSAIILYMVGRRVSEKTVRRIAGPGIERLKLMLQKEGYLAVAAVGLLPVAPFAAEVVVAGALRVPLLHLLVGVALAHLPGTIGTALLGDQLMAAMHGERQVNRLVIAFVIVMVTVVTFLTRRAWKRLEAAA